MPGYCWTCGWTDARPGGALDPDAKMCGWCLRRWAREYAAAHPPARDLGSRA